MRNLMLYIVCLILGMLIYNMIKNISSCKIVEGQKEHHDDAKKKIIEHIEVRDKLQRRGRHLAMNQNPHG